MPEYTYKTTDLEVLVATMRRTSLDFLYRMFAESGIQDFKILVINQTDEKTILNSDHPHVRVINSFETGLSKSRNLAIKNAQGPICVNLDDDVVLVPEFAINIIQAHNNFKDSIITFKTLTTEGNPYWKYPKEATRHTRYISQKTLSIEITYKVDLIRNQNLYFDERFGLGAQFEDAENFVFLMNARKKGILAYFSPQPLTVHAPRSSSDDVGTDRVLYAKAAIKTYAYGNFSYLWVLKFVFFILRKKYIPFVDIPRKLKIGFKSIADFKKTKPNENHS